MSPLSSESQATLLNPSSVSLVFSSDSMSDTSLLLGNGVLFRISTDKSGGQTLIFDQRLDRMAAVIERNNILPDTISFPTRHSGKKVKLSKWLTEQRHPSGMTVSGMETAIGKCFWKLDRTFRVAVFVSDDAELATPFAYLQPASSGSPTTLVIEASRLTLNEHGALQLNDPTTLEVLYDIVVATIVLEHKARMQEKRYQVADGIVQHRRTGILGDPIVSNRGGV
ncbi:hypothetical protein HGRIS_013874 [Hohenbuehelia grisea]|uniref:DUF6593 domain-containing protein n=1 Tax=Hohenbuehelia grisea TaxID=104357 RepID=A0ABR3IX49_9AGAR